MSPLRLLPLVLLLTACPAPQCDETLCGGCCSADGVCEAGTAARACGAAGFLCIECGVGQSCNQGACVDPPSCRPLTCAQAGATCGELPDGCGGKLSCGECGAGETCGGGGTANVCGPGTCNPKSCSALGAECGLVSDGCAAALDCGGCAQGQCGGGGANLCGSCVPKTCTELSRNCGLADDGCGGKASCGTCDVAGETCGGGGTANVCGTGACVPKTCTELAKECGDVPDGCGNTVACGGCGGFATCGGAGVANVCGAVCSAGCPGSFSCNAMGTCSGGSLTALVLNEVGHAVTGSIQVNGAAPTFSDPAWCQQSGAANLEVARVGFSEATKGYSASASIKCNSGFAFSATLPPGTYEVRVSRGQYADNPGINLLPVSYLMSPLTVNAPVSGLVLNEVGHGVTGSIQVSGAAPVYRDAAWCQQTGAAGLEVARVSFSEKAKGYSATASIKCNSGFAFAITLPPGTYEVRLSRGQYADNPGINLLPVAYLMSPVTVSGPINGLVLNELGHAVSGSIQVNGAAPTFTDAAWCQQSGAANLEIARVSFSETTKGYSATASIKCNSNFAFDITLPPGTYGVRVSRGQYADNPDINLLPVPYLMSPVTVNAAVSGLKLNEVGHAVSGSIQMNGATPTYTDPAWCQQSGAAGLEVARVAFTENEKGYSATASIKCNSGFAFAVTLAPGTYEVRLSRGQYADNPGINLLPVAYLMSPLTVSAPVSGVVLNELGHLVSGSIQVNGAPPTFSDAGWCQQSGAANLEVARVGFVEKTKGYSATASIKCNSSFAFNLTLPPGTYEVRVSRGQYADNPGINLLPVSYVMSPVMVSGPVSGVVLNELGRTVSGTVQVNGAAPTLSDAAWCQQSGAANLEIARVGFSELTHGYGVTASIKCNSNFGFSATMPPGTYEVRISRGQYADNAGLNVLPVSYVAVERLAVP